MITPGEQGPKRVQVALSAANIPSVAGRFGSIGEAYAWQKDVADRLGLTSWIVTWTFQV